MKRKRPRNRLYSRLIAVRIHPEQLAAIERTGRPLSDIVREALAARCPFMVDF